MRTGVRVVLSLILPAVFLLLLAPGVAQAAAPAAVSPLAQYRQWIHQARLAYPYPQTEAKMYRVMICESGGNRLAVGGGRWYGLFQYVPATWRGSWNPYRAASIYDAKAQIFATAVAWHKGMQSAWACFRLTR